MSFFIWLEGTALSVWIRETPSVLAFPFILYLHTLGLALIAGLSSAVALAILTTKAPLSRAPLYRLFPWMWTGLAINAVSGIALLIAYPAKALTNPVFYIKLVAITAAVFIVQWLQAQFAAEGARRGQETSGTSAYVLNPQLKRRALALILLWLIATLTGRMLAYTNNILLASFGF